MHLFSEQNLLQMETGYEKKSGTEEDSEVLDLNIWKHWVFTSQDGRMGMEQNGEKTRSPVWGMFG